MADSTDPFAGFKKDLSLVKDKSSFLGTSFYHTSFRHSEWSKINIEGATFGNADFSNSKICDCSFQSTTLLGVSFKDSEISNVNFHDNNVEFCDFTGATLKNVKFSLYQFPFIFGVNIQQLRSGDVKICILNNSEELKTVKFEQLNSLFADYNGPKFSYNF